MEALKLILIIAVVVITFESEAASTVKKPATKLAVARAGAITPTTQPAPTASTTTTKPDVPKILPPKGTTVKVNFSPALVNTLYMEAFSPPAQNDTAYLINKAAITVKQVAMLTDEAANFHFDAGLQKDPKEAASLLLRAAESRLKAQEKKRQVALLRRMIEKSARMSNESGENLSKLKNESLERSTPLSDVEKILNDTSPLQIPLLQLPSEVRKIKAEILKMASTLIEEENLADELESEMSPYQQEILELKKSTLEKERLAKGVDVRTRLMSLANDQDEEEVEELVKMLGNWIVIPIHDA